MNEAVYRILARRLDGIPNGFPATESGVELRLLARIFAPAEAELAGAMRLTFESPDEIAVRAGRDSGAVSSMLREMARRGLVRSRRGASGRTYGLRPFIVGIYEEQLPRMDREFASLFEQYYQEMRGIGMIAEAPPLHRVVPVNRAVPFDLEIFPYERASELIDGARSWGVRDCICRVQRRLVGKGCDHPVENCLLIAPVENAFDKSEVTRAISKGDALRILNEAADAGLVHSTANHRGQHYYICNCCVCCCGIMRAVAEFGIPTAVARSGFRSVVDVNLCTGCADCVERCQFGAICVHDGVCLVDYSRCVGCGLCGAACPTGALRLERRPKGDHPPSPANEDEWMAERAMSRGLSLPERQA